MSTLSLDSLDPREFMQIVPSRKAKIEAAPSSPIPKQYPANKLAAELHPNVQHLKIAEVTEHGPDAKSFVLVPDESRGTGACAYFDAGQYLSFSLTIGDASLAKPYSIRSGPGDALNGKYTITVKRSSDGYASSYILDNWKVGSEVTASGPVGNFCYAPLRDAKQIIGLAGGSGITPFYSIASAIADGTEDCTLTLLYGSRTQNTILLKDEFDKLAASCPDKISVIYVLSDEETAGFENGFLSAELIQKYAPKEDYSLFVCGPQAMYDFVDQEIAKLNLPAGQVRHELFGEFKHPENNPDYPQAASGQTFKVTVKVRSEKHTISCKASESLLFAMEQAGIAAPSLCRSGECGYCHSRLVSGDVYIPASVDGRRLADYKFGYIHPCSSFPITDVEIDVPVKI
jgi:ferredoxin-NADP reductase